MEVNTENKPLWVRTPLVHSRHLSARLQCDVYLKLENLQISQSFKYRGVSLFAQHCKETLGADAHLIIASGGNAGHAAAVAAKTLGMKCTVYIPEGTKQGVQDILKNEGSDIVVVGKYYLQTRQEAEKAAKLDPKAALVPAYDHPLIWKGHSSMIDEIAEDLEVAPGAIFCSVGGGGLLGGVLEGCKRNGWDSVPIIALETQGAAGFTHAISVNKGGWLSELPENLASVTYDEQFDVKVAHLKEIKTKACLGATSTSVGVIRKALDHPGGIVCGTIPDELAMDSSPKYTEEHKSLVELASATTLSPAYNPSFFSALMKARKEGKAQNSNALVFIVCGGIGISLEEMNSYERIVNSYRESKSWSITVNDKQLEIF